MSTMYVPPVTKQIKNGNTYILREKNKILLFRLSDVFLRTGPGVDALASQQCLYDMLAVSAHYEYPVS